MHRATRRRSSGGTPGDRKPGRSGVGHHHHHDVNADEEYARRLQEEFDREAAQQREQQRLMVEQQTHADLQFAKALQEQDLKLRVGQNENAGPEAIVAALPIMVHGGGLTEDCIVCYSAYEAGEHVKTLPCMHRYHRTCIDQWLLKKGTCPVCQHRVVAADRLEDDEDEDDEDEDEMDEDEDEDDEDDDDNEDDDEEMDEDDEEMDDDDEEMDEDEDEDSEGDEISHMHMRVPPGAGFGAVWSAVASSLGLRDHDISHEDSSEDMNDDGEDEDNVDE